MLSARLGLSPSIPLGEFLLQPPMSSDLPCLEAATVSCFPRVTQSQSQALQSETGDLPEYLLFSKPDFLSLETVPIQV